MFVFYTKNVVNGIIGCTEFQDLSNLNGFMKLFVVGAILEKVSIMSGS